MTNTETLKLNLDEQSSLLRNAICANFYAPFTQWITSDQLSHVWTLYKLAETTFVAAGGGINSYWNERNLDIFKKLP